MPTTNTNTVANVSTGKPKITGAVFIAPLGTTVPTDAVSELAEAFKGLGYCSEDGLTNSNSPEKSEIKAWGGDVILAPQSGKKDTYKLKLLEVLNTDVLKVVHGESNVTGTLAAGIAIKSNSKELEAHVWVIDMLLRNNAVKRIVLPHGEVSSIGDVVYKDGEPIGYEITINAMPDASGDTHHEYIKGAEQTTAQTNS